MLAGVCSSGSSVELGKRRRRRRKYTAGQRLQSPSRSQCHLRFGRTLSQWIAESARALAVYLGHFPIERVRIRIRMRDGHGASNGTTYGWHGGLITLSMGRGSTADDFAEDWLMTHEMLHLGFPSVPEQHHWIEEGISTYVEPIARCRAGLKTPEAVWKELMDGLPQGLPERGDQGLDQPPLGGAPTGAGRSSAC